VNKPLTVKITFLLVLVNALIWFGFGIALLLGIHPGLHVPEMLRWVMTILAWLAAACLSVLLVFLRRGNRLAYLLALAAMGCLTLLTFADDFGPADLAYLPIAATPFLLLLKDRRWYWENR
jgi:hypothetical protein